MRFLPAAWPRFIRPLLPARPPAEGGDADLVGRFVRSRDEAAFAALMERHGPMVLGVCRRVLRDWQDADDAFQATFLALVRKAAALRRPELLGNWLYGVAYRVALQARAGAARWRALERQVDDVPAAEPVDAKVWDELRPVLDAEIDRLPAKYRAPVILCYLEGKTYAEAARILGWPEGTVAGRLARARDKLRARFASRGLTLSAVVLTAALGQQGSAAVPAALAQATLKGALLAASGQAAGLISANAVALSQAALKAAVAAKLKVWAAVLTAGGVVGVAAWAATRWWPELPTARELHNELFPEHQLAADRDRLQGTWDCAARQGGGGPAPKALSWTFQGKTAVVVQDGDQQFQGTYRLTLARGQRRIDVTVPTAAAGAPVTFYGTYAFTKGALRVCVNPSADARPKAVEADPAADDVYYDFQRRR